MPQTYIFSSDGRPAAPTSEVVHAMFQRRKIRKLASVCCILIEVSELTFKKLISNCIFDIWTEEKRL